MTNAEDRHANPASQTAEQGKFGNTLVPVQRVVCQISVYLHPII